MWSGRSSIPGSMGSFTLFLSFLLPHLFKNNAALAVIHFDSRSRGHRSLHEVLISEFLRSSLRDAKSYHLQINHVLLQKSCPGQDSRRRARSVSLFPPILITTLTLFPQLSTNPPVPPPPKSSTTSKSSSTNPPSSRHGSLVNVQTAMLSLIDNTRNGEGSIDTSRSRLDMVEHSILWRQACLSLVSVAERRS